RLRRDPAPPTQFNCAITPQLERVVLRALERDPDRRYASAEEFARDLHYPEQAIELGNRNIEREQKAWITIAASYCAMLLIPTIILALLLYFARHQ
ncbi:MAG TPA: hypothetical protein VMU24_12010, partial [Candidatus Acidoferrales bacterium]|nr:hypothetical protein [Candidatus Acidoferrales bacterium]